MYWVCFGCSQTYGNLHGMWEMDFIEGTFEEALDVAKENAIHVCESYDCIYEPIEEEARGYDNYEAVYEELFMDEIEYSVFRLRDDVNINELYELNLDLDDVLAEYRHPDGE